MHWFVTLLIGLVAGGCLGVVLGSVLCAAGTDAARYQSEPEFHP